VKAGTPAFGPPAPLRFGEVEIELLRKKIKNMHLRVYPPDGRVRLSVPYRMPIEAACAFAASHLDWIRTKRQSLLGRERVLPFSYGDGESHYLWGTRYPLRVVEGAGARAVELLPNEILLRVLPGTTREQKGDLLTLWYRGLVRRAASVLIAEWEPRLGVQVNGLFVQRMKTRWGSCNIRHRHIRLNSELAKKPSDCFEYVVVHELAHLLVRLHDQRFRALLDRFLPDWRTRQRRLNDFPRGPAV